MIPDSNFEPNMKSWSAWFDTDKGKDGSMKPKKQSFEIGLLKKVRDTEYDHDARQTMATKPISNLKANTGL
jgi:hypothetical protein